VLRFLVDENLPRTLARDLVSAGYEATHARDVGLGGRPDRDLYDYAVAHNSIIVTCDLGFADQRRFPTGHSGIVLVRLPDDTPIDKRRHRVLSVLSSFDCAVRSSSSTQVVCACVEAYRGSDKT
jgi:predicted nuclease of predicted toxin-antitoxin system